MEDGDAIERKRVAELLGMCILDTPPEEAFDRITQVAARFFKVPVALVSLVDRNRQWFKSRHGLDVPETPRDVAFCAHTILTDEILLVENAATDLRFAANPLVVGPPHIRFYAGAPLITPQGNRLGTLCIIDFKPRPAFSDSERADLKRFADMVMDEFALRQELKARQQAESDLQRQTVQLKILAEQIDAAREEADRSRKSAEDANAAKTHFLASMSHELRTPMAGVMGIVDLLLDMDLPDEAGSLIRTLKGSADVLLTLLNDILDFSKIEAGQLRLETIDFSPRRILAEIEQLFTAAATEKGVPLSVSVDPDLPFALCGDPTRLRQVLTNLVCNALKFTADGDVEIRAQMLGISPGGQETPCPLIRFEVADTGIGMSPEQLGTLFQPFSQADVSTMRRFGGTGLGLAICKRLVDAMGGIITVDSVPERGSVFRVDVAMPVGSGDVAADTAAPQRTDAAPDDAGMRILLAEDNEVNRMVITTLLTRRGHRVTGVADGMQAVAAAEADDFDVVLMDMQMPVMDGVAATQAIRRLAPPRRSVPIVAFTADVLPEHQRLYRAAGVDHVLLKPVDREQLDRAIRHASGQPEASATAPPAVHEEPAGPACPLLDAGKVRALRIAIGDDGLDHVLVLLPRDLEKGMAAIEAALANDDLAAARSAAHRMRGMVGALGASRLGALCRRLEDHAEAAAALAPLMPTLRNTVAETLAGFAVLREEPFPSESDAVALRRSSEIEAPHQP